MSSNAKVGSWLEHNENGRSQDGDNYDNEEKIEQDIASGMGKEINWDVLAEQLRPSLMSGSKKKRRAFISCNLFVNADSPPPAQVSLIMTALLSCLSSSIDLDHSEDIVGVLSELLLRDERLEDEKKLKIGDKLVKWTLVEVEKTTNPAKTISPVTLFPFLLITLSLISALSATRTPADQFILSQQGNDLFLALALVLDSMRLGEVEVSSQGRICRLRKKAEIRLWRVLREQRLVLPTILQSLVTRTYSSPARLSILINHVIGVCLRLRPLKKEERDSCPSGKEIIEKKKDAVLSFYSSNILGAKHTVPRHSSLAFGEFLREFVSYQDLSETLIPLSEKSLLRSPEISLMLTADLISASIYDISSLLPAKLINTTLSASKSSNGEIRHKSLLLMKAILSKCSDITVQGKIANEVVSLPKLGKTTSPEHRATLFAILSEIPASESTSTIIVNILPTLIAKEGNALAFETLCSALSNHLCHALISSEPFSAASMQALVKEFSSTKISIRRGLSNAIGQSIWKVKEKGLQFSHEGQKLIAALDPVLENNLRIAASCLPANASGFLEGYVAIALAMGPLKGISAASRLNNSPVMKDLLAVTPKPSIILNDKAYQRLPSVEDHLWLLRSLAGLIKSAGEDINTEQTKTAVGLAFIHLTFDSKISRIKRDILSSLSELARQKPQVISDIIRLALHSWLSTQDKRRAAQKANASDEGDQIVSKSQDIGRLLSAIFVVGPDIKRPVLEDLAVDYIVLTHHPEISPDAQTSWIGLIQALGLDPATVAKDKKDKILTVLWQVAGTPPSDSRMAEAAYHAVTTLAFISPSIYVKAFVQQLKQDLDPESLACITLEERGIWATPNDTTFVDVLNQRKSSIIENRNRKDYATEKWEQEVREALAKKRAAIQGHKLNKQEQALVSAQLLKEKEIKDRMWKLQARLIRGTEIVAALAKTETGEVGKYVGEMATCLLRSVFGPASFFVIPRAFQIFEQLGSLASERLGETRRILMATILRTYSISVVPADYLEEPIGNVITRILHQIHFIAEQSPLDSVTYSLTALLLTKLVEAGGIGIEAQSEGALEQLTLVGQSLVTLEFSNPTYPRLQTISALIHILTSYSKLTKDTASVLADLGASIKDVASNSEIREMISGTLSKESYVRNAALQALRPVDITDLDYLEELWIVMHDEDEQNATLASHIWEDNGIDLPENYLQSLLGYLCHDSAAVRVCTAKALAEGAEHYPQQVEPTVQGLKDLYVEKAKLLVPEYDQFGMVLPETVNRPDPWESRVAIALGLEHIAPLLTTSMIAPIYDFFIKQETLGDRHSAVRGAMLNAAIKIIDLHGGRAVTSLMKMFEDFLATPTSVSETGDYLKEAVVILFGRLARHLDSTDEQIPKVVDRLVEALNTPSELVQSAVADCLPPLVQNMSEECEYLVDRLFSTLTTGAKYAARRGAAYGLAGVVKGRGLMSLKEYDLMDKLKDATEDKSAYQSRQGALFAYETLSGTLGKIFEPYVIGIIPQLLALFGDANTDVREATQDCARIIMSRVSGHCVKLMLPILLDALEEKQWRTKKGAIELLGAMAFCAPRQLSLSLPTIIPYLTGVINDSHAQVKSAANTSLKRFGEVLENPEIKSIQSTLMKALADPTTKTNTALGTLLKTTFEHYLDAPSLALVIPIIDRGLRQRSSETKRKAAQIVGNMASLTETRDLVPYLHQLMPLVHDVLIDPVPEARATAAKSLGTLVERLGETNFPNLVNELLQTLRSDTSGVDRQGAAQGLSEVLSGLGMERLEGLMPEIISNTASARPYVREGFISLLVYLPTTFGHRFAPHLGRVIPPILNGLADDSEYGKLFLNHLVREASMRAGKMIIANYSGKAVDLLLPELEKGMLDPSWRIRQSSISLTGELLYKITGISGKVELEEEDAPTQSADHARKALLEALGSERRDKVLATLYIVRQDAVGIVRQASIHIWKALVQNTPRTTRDILGVLMQMLMSLLSSSHVEQQETASRTVGELCRKNGERIFGEIVPILQKATLSISPETKKGACLAFADIMASTNKDVISQHENVIITSIRTALVDSNPHVRAAAAQSFDSAQHYIGAKAIDQTIPTLLEAIRHPGESSETALQALQEVMSVRANSVFPVLIPTLIAQPISAFNARALGQLVKVAGPALNKRLDTVLTALVQSLESESSGDVLQELKAAVSSLLEAVVDPEGVHVLEMLLIGWARDANPTRRATACQIFGIMCQVSEADTSEYRVDWIRVLVTLFDDSTEDVVAAAWEALDNFVKIVDKSELEDLVVPLRRTIESVGAPGRPVPGFSRPKGVQSIVPILLGGVLSGTQEQKEQAALGIGELVQRTTEAAIKPYIIQLAGPLIRVISGQAIAPQIKTAILSTLTVLLQEVPQLVKPFHPQLTRTFVKSAQDPASLSVRNKAAVGLGELMKYQPRVDPLITELIGGVQSGDNDIAPSMANALAAVCTTAGKNIGVAAKASIVELIEDAFEERKSENYNQTISRVVAGLAQNDPTSINTIIDNFLAPALPPTPLVSIMILTILEEAPDTFYELDCVEEIVQKVMASLSADIAGAARPAKEARDLMRKGKYGDDEKVQSLLK
nr:50S small subunit ribosomal protein L19 [Cryptococcus depauperatus CBS 7841]